MTALGPSIGFRLKEEAVKAAIDWNIPSIRSLRQAHILVVDDDWGVRETLTLLLSAAGYETTAAPNGIEALQRIKRQAPTLLLCDLEMPEMSGFELLSIVRRRFPGVAVIAMSGCYGGDHVPEDVIADAFYGKGEKRPPELFRIVEEAIRTSAFLIQSHEAEPAPTWGRWIGRNSCGTSLVMVTCADCLRSFPVAMSSDKANGIYEARCVFCTSEIRYIVHQYSGEQISSGAMLSTLVQDQDTQISSQARTPLQK